jgi:sulfane dehydrogenase subunit SoxC
MMSEPTDMGEGLAVTSRRRFLRIGGALVGGIVVAGDLAGSEALAATENADNLPPNIPEWMKTPGDPMGSQLYGTPSPFEKNVVKNKRRPPGCRQILRQVLRENPGYKKPYGKTASDLVGLLSCAEWTGVSLKLVLQEAGLQAGAKWVIAEGADSAAMTRSIPIEKCLEDAMLVYSQNGERLRPQQGYPLRLLLPGFEGNMSIKWLRRLHVAAEPAYSREETSKYTDLMPDGSAREFTFFMEAKSIITRPSGGQRLNSPGFHEISGIAWSGRGKIGRVDISVDDGKSWQEAQLQEPVLTRALTRFRLPWHWNGQPAVIQSRAIDQTGYVQPTLAELLAVRGENYFYHNNAIWPWRISAGGEVTNANA